jgi:hypothetical protein
VKNVMPLRLSPLFVRALVGAFLAACVPASAGAQVVTQAPRGFRGIFGGPNVTDPSRPRQDLLFTLNATAGRDDNAAAGDAVGPPVVGADPLNGAGYTGEADLALRYTRASQDRSVDLSTWGSFATYRNVDLADSRGAGVGISAQTSVSPRSHIGGSARFGYRSQLPLDRALANALPEAAPTPESITGVLDRGSLLTTLGATADRRWTRRTTTSVGYNYATTQFMDNEVGDMRDHRVVASYIRQFSRAGSLSGVYEYGNSRIGLGDNDPGEPRTEHRVSGGFAHQRRIGTTRTADFNFQAGALRVDSIGGTSGIAYQSWVPYAEVGSHVTLTRVWSLDASYRRSAQSMAGFDVPETYVSDTINASVGRVIGSRVDLVVSGAYSTGAVPATEASTSEYVTAGAATQVRVAITRGLAAVVGYNYYRYEFNNTVLPTGLPSTFDRSAIRVGLSLSLPLYGGYTDNGR